MFVYVFAYALNHCLQLQRRPAVWTRLALFAPQRFYELVSLIHSEWKKPRQGIKERPRKHGCAAILFAVLGLLTTGMGDLAMEGLAEIPASLCCIEFERVLHILDSKLDDLHLLSEEEKVVCIGSAKAHPNILYYVDGCDFPIRCASEGWMYNTHKPNCPKQRGIRAQILCDSGLGLFRGVEVAPCGLFNDQAMLLNSDWNQPDKLTRDNEYVAADKGYASTEWINVMKPFSQKDLVAIPSLKLWSQYFNEDRGLIERNFAAVKGIFRIFDSPWRRNMHLFPLALTVALKLLNHYWSLPENMSPGMRRKYNI